MYIYIHNFLGLLPRISGSSGGQENFSRIIFFGDSTTDFGADYIPQSNTMAFYNRGYQSHVMASLGYAVPYARNSNTFPTGQFFFGQSSQRLDQLLTDTGVGIPRIIQDYGTDASRTLVFFQGGGNDLGALETSGQVFSDMTGCLTALRNAGFPVATATIRPRLYLSGGSPSPETGILPHRLGFNSLLINYCQQQNIPLARWEDRGNDVSNSGYMLTGEVDNVHPGHPKAKLASEMASDVIQAINSFGRLPAQNRWFTDSFRAGALNNPSNPSGDPSGNCFLTGLGIEGSVPVAARTRISTTSGGTTWDWSTGLTIGGETGWRRLRVLTNSGKVYLNSSNSAANGLGLTVGTGYFSRTGDYMYAVAQISGEPSGWAFKEVALTAFAGGNFTTVSALNMIDVDPKGVISRPSGQILVTPPAILGSGATSFNGRLMLEGTGTIYLKYIGIHNMSVNQGPFSGQYVV